MKMQIWLVGIFACFFSTITTAQHEPLGDPKNAGRVIIKREKKEIDMAADSIYQERIKLKEIEGVYIPKDLNDCFKELDKLMEDEVRQNFMAFSDEEVDKRTHGSLGFWLNHKWSLAEGSRLSAYFNKMQVPHYEYMIGIIIQSYHRYLHKRDLKIKEQVEHFRNLWNEKQKKIAEEMLKKNKG